MDKIALLSLSNDLKRICLSIQRGSFDAAEEFNKEARRWLLESLKTKNTNISELLKKVDRSLKKKNDLVKAEDCLMYSVLLQNRAMVLKSSR